MLQCLDIMCVGMKLIVRERFAKKWLLAFQTMVMQVAEDVEGASSRRKEVKPKGQVVAFGRDEQFARSQARSASDRISARIYCLVNHLVAANLLAGRTELTARTRRFLFLFLLPPRATSCVSFICRLSLSFACKHSLFEFDSADVCRCILNSFERFAFLVR